MSYNEIYLLIKYIKSVLWRVVKRLSYYKGRTVPKGWVTRLGFELNAKYEVKLHSHTSIHPSLKGRHINALHDGTQFYLNILTTKCRRIRTIAFWLLINCAGPRVCVDQINSSVEEASTFLRNVRTDMTLHSTVIWATAGAGPPTPTDWVGGKFTAASRQSSEGGSLGC